MKKILLTKKFTDEIQKSIVPFLLEQNFISQGIDTYQRYMKPFVHCIWFQEKSNRKSLCVNLGVHLDFMPLLGMVSIPNVNEITQPACIITDRLMYKNHTDCWWPYNRPKKQVSSIIDSFQKEGIPFFDKYTSFPDIFLPFTVNDIEKKNTLDVFGDLNELGVAELLTYVFDHIGQKEKTIQFCEYALSQIGKPHPQFGKSVKKPLQDILKRNRR